MPRALALGADAVPFGRPVLHGLAAASAAELAQLTPKLLFPAIP